MAGSCRTSNNSCSLTWPLARRSCGLRSNFNLTVQFQSLYALHDVCLQQKYRLLSPSHQPLSSALLISPAHQSLSSALLISPAHQSFSSALLISPSHQPCLSALLISPSHQPFLSALQLLTCTCMTAYTCRPELLPVMYSARCVMQCCTRTQNVVSDHLRRSAACGFLWRC